MSQLSDYVQKLIAQGYSSTNIRSTLLSAGYSSSEIESAFGKTSRTIRTLPLVLALVVVLAIIGIGIYLFAPTQSQPLNFSAELLTPTSSPGDSIAIAAHITNPNMRKVNTIVTAQVRAPNGTTYAEQKTIQVENEASVPLSIPLPSNAAAGRYAVTVKFTGGLMPATQTLYVNVAPSAEIVTSEEREEQAIELQNTCPNGCDDQNFCTTDTCNKGTCEHLAVTPCCGNRNCETGESESSCVIDCSKRVTSTDIRTQALGLAGTNVQQAITTCASLAQQSYIDECLASVSDASANKLPCETIVSDDMRDACYIPFSYKNDFSVCEKIVNQAIKNSCTVLAQVQSTSAP